MSSFPPLYECSKCGASVKVTVVATDVEPLKEFSCGHVDAIIWANRKVTLRGKGELEKLSLVKRSSIKITLTVRQLLSGLLGRSI